MIAKTVVIVEDERISRMIMEKTLKSLDFTGELHTFREPVKARNFIQKHSVDLVVCDHYMPYMTGIELAHFCSQISPIVPVVIVTAARGHEFNEIVTKAKEVGAAAVYQKPIDSKTFSDQIKRLELVN